MSKAAIEVKNIKVAYGTNVLMHDVSFTVNQGDIFIIMGASGSGKSTMLRVLTGLKEPSEGNILINGKNLWGSNLDERNEIMQQSGILYQSGALFSSMTIGENIAMPLQQYTDYSQPEIDDLVALKLALVGLDGYGEFYPAEISGGMKKRAGLARALALDPKIVYFDEPSAGLDPVSSKLLDDLILEINESLGMTIVIVSHELASIYAIGTNSIYLDNETKTITARGNPNDILKNPPNDKVLSFMTRGMSGNEKTTK